MNIKNILRITKICNSKVTWATRKNKNLKEKNLKSCIHDFLFNEPEKLFNNFNENTEDLIMINHYLILIVRMIYL